MNVAETCYLSAAAAAGALGVWQQAAEPQCYIDQRQPAADARGTTTRWVFSEPKTCSTQPPACSLTIGRLYRITPTVTPYSNWAHNDSPCRVLAVKPPQGIRAQYLADVASTPALHVLLMLQQEQQTGLAVPMFHFLTAASIVPAVPLPLQRITLRSWRRLRALPSTLQAFCSM
jgi:hypothetical protein